MREIKFRAWNINTGHMWNLQRMNLKNGQLLYEGSNLPTSKDNLSNHIVMQYTGLKDKNGKEIYEGDILKGRKYYITVVFYKGMFSGKQHGVSYSEPLASWEMNCFEIIGNIYENPELLKVNQPLRFQGENHGQ